MTPALSSELRAQRQAVVDQHVNAENTGDMDAMIASFRTPRYEVFPMGAVFEGEQSVRDMVGGLVAGFPDFKFTPLKTHHSEDAVIVEGLMTGTHRGEWAGMTPKGNKLELPLVCIFDFDGADLVNEKVYFDFAAVQRQLS